MSTNKKLQKHRRTKKRKISNEKTIEDNVSILVEPILLKSQPCNIDVTPFNKSDCTRSSSSSSSKVCQIIKWRLVFINMDNIEIGDLIEESSVIRQTLRYFDSQMRFMGLSKYTSICNEHELVPYDKIQSQIVDNISSRYSEIISQVVTIPVTLQMNVTKGALEWLRVCLASKHEDFRHPTQTSDTVLTKVCICGCEIRATLKYHEPHQDVSSSSSNDTKIVNQIVCDDESGMMYTKNSKVYTWYPSDETQRTKICKILYFKTCNVMTKSCSDCHYFDDVIDPLIAFGIASQLDADRETHTLLASAFIWHFAARCSAFCADAVDKYIETHTYLRSVLDTILEYNSKDIDDNIFIPSICKDCLRCIILKDCNAAMRLANMNITLDRPVTIWPTCDVIGLPDVCKSVFEKSIAVTDYVLMRPIKRAKQYVKSSSESPFIGWDAILGLSILSIIDPNINCGKNAIDVVLENPIDPGYTNRNNESITTTNDSCKNYTQLNGYLKTPDHWCNDTSIHTPIKKSQGDSSRIFTVTQQNQKHNGGCRVFEVQYVDKSSQTVAYHSPTFRCCYNYLSIPPAKIINRKLSRVESCVSHFRGHGKDCLLMPMLSVLRFAYFPDKCILCASIQALVSVFITKKILHFGRRDITPHYDAYDDSINTSFGVYQTSVVQSRSSKVFEIDGFCYDDSGFSTTFTDNINRLSLANAIRWVVELETSDMNKTYSKDINIKSHI